MAITGTFNTFDNNETYSVNIGTTNLRTEIVDPTETYDSSETVIMFDPDPVTISTDRSDLQKRVIISQASINLVSDSDLTEYLFADTNRTIPVEITCNDNTVFFGYVDPLQFDQGYARHWEHIQVNATDPLGGLDDIKIGQLIYNDTLVQSSTTLTCKNLMDAIFDMVLPLRSIEGDPYDYSNVNQTVLDALENTNVKLSIFFGDSPDDWMTLNETITEICKYFNLYIAYNGNYAIVTCTVNNDPGEITITDITHDVHFKDIAADDSTSLSTDDIYSQASITCKIEPVDDIIIPIDAEDYLYSDFDRPETYMKEYISEGEGKRALNGFKELILNGNTAYENGYIIENYAYVLKNKVWDFGPQGYDKQQFEDQCACLRWLKNNSGKGAIIGFSRGNKINLRDNSIQGNPDVTPYFVISINGTYNNTEAGANGMQGMIYNAQPVCSFKGLSSAILSPSDAEVTNYISISGKILLNALQKLTGPYWSSDSAKLTNTIEDCERCFDNRYFFGGLTLWHHTVPNPNNDDGAYYQQLWMGPQGRQGASGIYGNLDNSKNCAIEYKYSANGDSTDKISKLPILACQLIVGEAPSGQTDTRKYCVERLDQGDAGWGVFEWMTLADIDRINANIRDETQRLQPYFTIGTNPKIGDFIVGQSNEISRNEAFKSGTCIPIKLSDQLAGEIEFKILGPYNMTWKDITRIHPSFWRHTRWINNPIPILQNIQSIMISNLKIEVGTDNGLISELKSSADNDLVYYSDTNPLYIEKLEDDIKICTPLTLEECESWGIKYQVSNSYIYDINNEPFYGFQSVNQGTTTYVKPEHCLVDYYYKEYCSPSRIISTAIKTDALENGIYGVMINDNILLSYIDGLPISGNYRIMKYETDLKAKKIEIEFREHKTVSNIQI